MAQITITINDTVVPRIKTAFGQNGQDATLADVADAIKNFLKSTTIAFEIQQANTVAETSKQQETW